MQRIGLIAEYNPIHNGHIYQIKEIKRLYPDSIIILITNSYFTQRGDISIINKWDKTKISLDNNIDLVIELPFPYATQSADIFAKGALKILNFLQIDTLIFGSESNDINKLKKLASTQLNNKKYDEKVKTYLNQGINYPTAMSNSLKDILGYTTSSPNDLLGISYIKEIIRNNYKINTVSIKRTIDYHSKIASKKIASATLIRTLIREKKDITNYIPKYQTDYFYQNLSLESYFPYIKYKIITSTNLAIYKTVDEGIENRINKVINSVNSWKELVEKIKNKRYTYNKINRMLIHILTNFTKDESSNLNIDYIRVLGFSKKGRLYLSQIKKDLKVPLITNYKPNLSPLLDIEFRVAKIYSLPLNKNIIEKEYKQPPIYKRN